MLFNIVGGSDLKLSELHEAAEVIQRVVDPDANIIFGMGTDLKMENEIKMTIIATGFPTMEMLDEQEDHISRLLKDALHQDETDLDLPPFLRRFAKNGSQKTAAAKGGTELARQDGSQARLAAVQPQGSQILKGARRSTGGPLSLSRGRAFPGFAHRLGTIEDLNVEVRSGPVVRPDEGKIHASSVTKGSNS